MRWGWAAWLAAWLAAWVAVAGAETGEWEGYVRQLTSQDLAERRDGSYRLSQMGRDARPAVPDLIRALEDEDFQVWFNSIMALARIGPEASAAIPTLVEQLGSSRRRGGDQRQYRVAFALGSVGEAALPAIREALGSERAQVRAGAAKAAIWVGPSAVELIPVLSRLLEDENRSVREASVEALGAMGGAVLSPMMGALKEMGARGREGAASALGLVAEPGAGVVAELAAICRQEQEAAVRAALIETLSTWRYAPEEFLGILVPALRSDSEALERAAMNALILLERPAATSVPALEALLSAEDLRAAERAARTLGHIGVEAASAVAALERLAGAESVSEELRGVIRESLERVRP